MYILLLSDVYAFSCKMYRLFQVTIMYQTWMFIDNIAGILRYKQATMLEILSHHHERDLITPTSTGARRPPAR